MNKYDNDNKRNLKKYLEKNVNSIIFLILLTVIVSIITYYRILVQIEIGPISDSLDFLSNALVFAGQSIGFSDLLRPPFFSFVTSLIFRLGYISATTIFVVDGAFFVFGVIGLFLLLKIWFNDLESFLGGLLYATFPIVLTILSVGYSDLTSISFSIWAIYFLILAIKKDSRFFYLAFPFAMLAFLTRYNSALLIFPIFIYILMNKDKINLKNISIGIISSFLIIVPVFIFFYKIFGNMIYPFLNFVSTSSATTTTFENLSYYPDIFFYLQTFPSFVGAQGITILLIIVLGVIYLLFRFVKEINVKKDFLNFNDWHNLLKLILFIILGIIFLGSFGKTFYILSEIIFFVLSYLIYDLSKNFNINLDIQLMFFTWFMTFFIFHSIYVIKDFRYFVIMGPPLVYFMILGLSNISNRMKFTVKSENITFQLFAIILISIILLSTVSQISTILQTNNDKLVLNDEIVLASQWFVSYDPTYKQTNIYSDYWPNFSWYLKTNVKPVPIFKDNKTILLGYKDFNFNQTDSNQFNNYLKTYNADYYFSVRQGLNLTSFIPIKKFGYLIIYKKKSYH